MQETTTRYQFQHHARAQGRDSYPSIMFTESRHLAIHGENGAVTTELMSILPHGPTIGRVVSTGHEIELREADNITFLLPRAGRLDIRIRDRSYAVHTGRLMAFRPTERRTRSVADPISRFRAATLQVSMARLRALAQAAGTSDGRAFAAEGVPLTGEAGLLLSRTLPVLADDLFLRPALPLPDKVCLAIGHLIDDLLCEMIAARVAETRMARIFPAFHRVRQAEDIIQAQSDDPVSIQDIARALGVSLRSLQLAFNEVHEGQSPRDYLTRVRLEKARQRLLAATPDKHVTTIALDSGFFHLSRFAQAYARTFGERPSETLARRGARPI